MRASENQYWPGHLPYELALPSENLWDNLEASARRHPRKAALRFFETDISYSSLQCEAEALAGFLQRKGLGRGDRLMVCLQNCPQFIVTCYAAFRIGAVIVPVNPMNSAGEIRFVIDDCTPAAIVAAADLVGIVESAVDTSVLAEARPARVATHYRDSTLARAESIPEPSADALRRMLSTEDAGVSGWDDWRTALSAGERPGDASVGLNDLALLSYTSGTTGMPKGCMHTHRSLLHNAMFGRWTGKSHKTVNLCVTPMFHITGMMDSVLGSVYDGATAVLLPRWNRRLAVDLISRHGVTHWTTVPTMIIDLFGRDDYKTFDFAGLGTIIGGGAAMPEAVSDRLRNEFGLAYIEGYGLTETAAPTHCNPVGRPKAQCLGIPIFGVESRVLDPSTLAEVAEDAVGEIVTRGPMLFSGYWKQAEATENAFVEFDGRRYFRTGDLGRVDADGYFFIADRIKRMINASGFKVWPSEVELTLFKCPGVLEACVVAAKDSYRGESVKAFIVLRDEAKGNTTEADIIAWSRKNMAVYKVPRQVEFVDSLPKLSSGKVAWRELQERAMQPAQTAS